MKLSSRLLSTDVEFYWQKQQNRVLCHHLADLGVTNTVNLWLVGKRVVDFLLVLIELFCQLSRLRRDEPIFFKIVVLERGWVTLSANFRGGVGSPANDWSVRTLESLYYQVALFA